MIIIIYSAIRYSNRFENIQEWSLSFLGSNIDNNIILIRLCGYLGRSKSSLDVRHKVHIFTLNLKFTVVIVE